MWEWLKKRAAERSTWAGILTLAAICGIEISPELSEEILKAVSAIIAVIFTFSADRAKARATDENKSSVQAGSASKNFDADQQ